MMSVVMGLVIIVINSLNNTSVIDAVYILASYTYGPILGMFAFGICTKKQVRDKYVPLVAVISPILCFILQKNSQVWFNGYTFSYELLIFNALFTFIGFTLIMNKQKQMYMKPIRIFVLSLLFPGFFNQIAEAQELSKEVRSTIGSY